MFILLLLVNRRRPFFQAYETSFITIRKISRTPYRGSLDIFKDNVCAADVDHVQPTAHNQTPLREIVPVSLSESCLESRVLDDGI